MSKVDILVPAFNAAHFLPGAIESVIAQTEEDWRIVLVDDGSTDNTREVAAPYLERLGSRMVYVYQENRGLPAARNTGIRNSDSPLLALLDADDLWLPNRLADTLARFHADPELGLTYGGIVRFREPGVALDTFYGNTGQSEGHVAEAIYTRSIDLPCPTITFRRACVDAAGYFDETMRATEDRDMWLRIAQHFRVGFIPEVLAWYRMSGSSMSADMPRMLTAQKQFIDKHYGEPGCGWTARRTALARVYRQQAEGYADRGEYATALRDALRAIALAPWKAGHLRTAASVAKRALILRR